MQESILSVLERGAEVSVRILEQLLGAGEVRIHVRCFDYFVLENRQ